VSARDTPGAIEWLIRRTAEQDGKAVTQVFWQDPGQAGVHQETTLRRLLAGYKVVFCRTVNPIEAARVASREVYGQRVVVTENTPWYAGAMHEMESFPDGQHDDIVSAFALGCLYWLDAHSTSPGRTVALNGPTQELYAPLTVRFRDY
jgi:phage terminase large subunit-like protein